MMPEPDKPEPRRRFRQFSLRTMLVVLTVFCVWLGWTVHRANEQKKAVEWVREMGGSVWCENYKFDAHGHFIADAEPPGPKWLVQLLGADYFQEVSIVWLVNTPVSGEQVENLRQALPNCDIVLSPPSSDPSP